MQSIPATQYHLPSLWESYMYIEHVYAALGGQQQYIFYFIQRIFHPYHDKHIVPTFHPPSYFIFVVWNTIINYTIFIYFTFHKVDKEYLLYIVPGFMGSSYTVEEIQEYMYVVILHIICYVHTLMSHILSIKTWAHTQKKLHLLTLTDIHI